MSNFILIFVCLFLGLALRLTNKFPPKAHQILNSFIIHVSLPATILIQIPKLLKTTELSASLLVPVSMAWITFILAFLFFRTVGRALRWSEAETGALVLTAGLGNTSFVGFPILEALIGPHAIPVGVLVDQLGSFLTISTLGLIYATVRSPSENRTHVKIDYAAIFKKLVFFPPFAVLVFSFLWFLSGTTEGQFVIQYVNPALEHLASTLVPIALVAVGFQLRFDAAVMNRQKIPLALGLVFKLVIIPLFFYGLYVGVFKQTDFQTQVTLLESAMASMITAGVVAEEFGFDAEISSLMVGVGIPLSLVTTYLWHTNIFSRLN